MYETLIMFIKNYNILFVNTHFDRNRLYFIFIIPRILQNLFHKP